MDNNYVEQAIQPFTLGRKNFVLIESSNKAKVSAILYSLVETAKANGLNTFEYFNLLLTEIPQHMKDSRLSFLDNLLPWSSISQKYVPVNVKSLNFSMYSLFFSKSAQSPETRGFLLISYSCMRTYVSLVILYL